MELTPEQKQMVASWVAAGDNLSTIQRKLSDQLKVSMTYMDARFLVDDLNLQLKDPPPKAGNDLSKAAAAPAAAKPGGKKGFFDKAKEKLGIGQDEEGPDGEEEVPPEPEEPEPAATSHVTVDVDKVTLIPGAIAGGTATFSDGVTGKWVVDNYGRPGFMEFSRPDYRPSAADSQAFMQELSIALQKRGI